jgi:hypothetical protein
VYRSTISGALNILRSGLLRPITIVSIVGVSSQHVKDNDQNPAFGSSILDQKLAGFQIAMHNGWSLRVQVTLTALQICPKAIIECRQVKRSPLVAMEYTSMWLLTKIP